MKQLGNMGITTAILTDAKGNIIGTCLDTPNQVAAACVLNSNVCNASGILGNYDMKKIEDKKYGLDLKYHKKTIHFK